jgi:hypothetical protein
MRCLRGGNFRMPFIFQIRNHNFPTTLYDNGTTQNRGPRHSGGNWNKGPYVGSSICSFLCNLQLKQEIPMTSIRVAFSQLCQSCFRGVICSVLETCQNRGTTSRFIRQNKLKIVGNFCTRECRTITQHASTISDSLSSALNCFNISALDPISRCSRVSHHDT